MIQNQPKTMSYDFFPPIGGVFHPNANGSVKLVFNPEKLTLANVAEWAKHFTGTFLEMARIQQKMHEKALLDRPVVLNTPVKPAEPTVLEKVEKIIGPIQQADPESFSGSDYSPPQEIGPEIEDEKTIESRNLTDEEIALEVWARMTPDERIAFGTKCMAIVDKEINPG